MQIVVAGEQPSSRRAISLLVRKRFGLEGVGEARNYEELMSMVEAATPDLILLDSEFSGVNTYALITTLRELNHPPSVIFLDERRELEDAALAAGADAFVCKDSQPKQLLIAIETVRIEKRHL